MTKFKVLALGVLTAITATSALADNKFSVGAGVGVLETPYKDYDRKVVPVPVITYEGDDFWFRGLGGGYYLWNDESDKLSVTAYYSPFEFKPKDSDNWQLRQLDKRKATLMAGLSYVHNTQYGFLRTSLAGDTLDNSNGISWDLAWLYRYTNGGLTLTPGIGVEWSSENMNEYYYGVSGKESRRSGLDRYDPDSDWSPYLELSASYKLSDDWSVYGVGRYTHLSSEVKDSPMVDKSWAGALSAGVTYSF
ncbi:MipA/OmpV family protein [Enterobacter kobei]|uniref:MltA-interacting protein MipA n=2 Tax=Enterobacter kobei TaxID=208224 RepID=A0AA86M9S0_9ENTR|nr:MipA/OmpV family protein [Enterobacter kobei]MDF3008273.1 MltA-interacting protein MipA [Enterobacter kobei]OLR20763.1 MltA-interacting protein MipA [Enterobacter kobei]WNP32954.1 MipA/OmpV family protein [Enterobacter kobei]SIR73312.1 outer membrane protein [Enterobacter kobei]BCU55932.1 MltA-interacting protein MipA [Enterobacter kobei]